MRPRRYPIIALALLLISGVASDSRAQDPSLEEVLSRYYDAIGGEQAWETVQSMRAKGQISLDATITAPFTMYAERPFKIRFEIKMQGTNAVQGYDGKKGWEFIPFAGQTQPEQVPAYDARGMREEADFEGPLMNWQEKGYTLELLGRKVMEGTETFEILVVRKDGERRFYYIDAEFYVPILSITEDTSRTPKVVSQTTYADYKEIDGLMVPHSVASRGLNKRTGQAIVLDSVEFNVEMDDGLFKMPKK